MKNLKIFAAAIAICGASLVGYNAYSNATMTDQERLIQQNLEALTVIEETDRIDCELSNGDVCPMLVITPNGNYQEYLDNYKKRIGWI